MASTTNSVQYGPPPPPPPLVRSNGVLNAQPQQAAPAGRIVFANLLGKKLTENEKSNMKFSRGGRGSKRSKRNRSKRNRSKRSGRK